MQGPETRFIASIHRKLKAVEQPPLIYRLNLRFQTGIPDVLYIGTSGRCLWVEYKVHPNNPTPLQRNTLDTLVKYNQQVAILTKKDTTTHIHYNKTKTETKTPWLWILSQLEATPPCVSPERTDAQKTS